MKTLFEGGTFFEGPRWHDGAWYVADMYAHQVLRITPDGAATVVVELPQRPSGIGWLPDGSMLVVSMLDRRLMRCSADGRQELYADLAPHTPWSCNDMVVDAQGRAWVGNFGFDLFDHAATPAETTLLRVDPDRRVSVAAEGLRFPNGTVVTGDGRTLIVAESFGACLTAFDIAAGGALVNRRRHALLGRVPAYDSIEHMLDTDFIPDGCGIDAEDHVWVADAKGGRACRVAPDGRVVETVHSPNGYGVYACVLGGAAGNQLMLCTAPDFDSAKRSASREAVLFVAEVRVPRGRGLP